MPTPRPKLGSPAGEEADRPSRKLSRLLLAFSAASLLAAALVLVWVVNHDDHGQDSPGMQSHIHGMAVNPSNSRLYVATHEGLFVLDEDGTLGLVGQGRQDTMGFSLAAPDHFLASGHPAPEEDGPSSLGLIESMDAGVTWKQVSMGGQADFHVLRYAHGIVYGVDAHTGRLLVSDDLVNWEARSSEPLIDLVVNPMDPDSIVATGPSGVLRSSDGGRTWEPVAAEAMALLHWSNSGLLWGVGPNGEIYKNEDKGVTWEPAITSVEMTPAAFTAVGDELFLATDDGRILASDDWGWNWEEIFHPGS